MKYYRWTHKSDFPEEKYGILTLDLKNEIFWKLEDGVLFDDWSQSIPAYFSKGNEYADFPFTIPEVPVYSAKLKEIVADSVGNDVQFLPLCAKDEKFNGRIHKYWLANYLRVLDCLDRKLSDYEIWTKENLLFWEQRPLELGKFSNVNKAVLNMSKIGDAQLFRVWGWEVMVVIREDLKLQIENANLTGCMFGEVALTL